MVVFAHSPRGIIIASICTLAIIAFTYFVIVQPQLDTANKQVDDALKQAAPAIDNAQRLSDCIATAAGDAAKIQTCTTKYR
jgi:hypothetical protein